MRGCAWYDDPEQLLNDDEIDLIVTAAVPDRRAPIAIEAMRNGKDVVADKPGCVTFEQLEQVRTRSPRRAGSGRSPSRSASRSDAWPVRASWSAPVGSVRSCRPWGWVRTARKTATTGRRRRPPDWFYDRDRFGGILTDIASHQIDQFLWSTGATTAEVVASTVANYTHPDQPMMQDFGAGVAAQRVGPGYNRVDWHSRGPAQLG